ncbi:DUF3566 domain-containing protein [Spirillospora albida]|uniref:DUF3566 domain-containing protein n=1 Tax=Spirillospora albida TaxID=58123 RepID=UPI000B03D1D2|nr:DUF3566 domain-containing protein [Spirillospora albida]
MSTEPGKTEGGSGKGAQESGGAPATKVADAPDKAGRDEADETRVDLVELGEKADSAAEDAPDTAADEASEPEPEAEPEKADKPGKPAKDAADGPDWAKPAEPASSVSRDRTETPVVHKEATGNSSSSSGGFTGTVLNDRPAAQPDLKPATTKPSGDAKPARRAQLQLARLEPWSVMKFSFVMSVVCFVVLIVAVTVLYGILSALGVFDAISGTINSATKIQGESGGGVEADNWFSFFRVFGYTVLVGALNVLLITALSTVGSVIYNLAADLVGGVEVTLKEAE